MVVHRGVEPAGDDDLYVALDQNDRPDPMNSPLLWPHACRTARLCQQGVCVGCLVAVVVVVVWVAFVASVVVGGEVLQLFLLDICVDVAVVVVAVVAAAAGVVVAAAVVLGYA